MDLKPCPDSPNCVSSLADPSDRRHHVAPFVFAEPVDDKGEVLKVAVDTIDGVFFRAERGYMRFVFTSKWFRFRDDLELKWEPGDITVHVRSSSRVGHSDLGANRKRVEALRRALGSVLV